MKESQDSNKVVLTKVTPQSDTKDIMKKLVDALSKQGIKVVPSKENSLLKEK